jgi:hypothetical protein
MKTTARRYLPLMLTLSLLPRFAFAPAQWIDVVSDLAVYGIMAVGWLLVLGGGFIFEANKKAPKSSAGVRSPSFLVDARQMDAIISPANIPRLALVEAPPVTSLKT